MIYPQPPEVFSKCKPQYDSQTLIFSRCRRFSCTMCTLASVVRRIEILKYLLFTVMFYNPLRFLASTYTQPRTFVRTPTSSVYKGVTFCLCCLIRRDTGQTYRTEYYKPFKSLFFPAAGDDVRLVATVSK